VSAVPQPRPSGAGTVNTAAGAGERPVRLGLRANWPQFTLLTLVNAFVGGMAGLERATTSLIGARVFHLSGYLAIFFFIIAFGPTKAAANLAVGPLTVRYARKHLLAAGLPAAIAAGGALTFASGLLAARWITGRPPAGPPRARQRLPSH
jgi:hypothetical protein